LFGRAGDGWFCGCRQAGCAETAGGGYQKIVLFAPTFRDEEFQHRAEKNTNIVLVENLVHSIAIKHALIKHNACIIVKLHPFVRNIYQDPLNPPFYKSEPLGVCIEHLMAASSCMISDYSSTIIDWMQLARPMILYCPDLADYKTQRGFPYYDYEEMFDSLLAADAEAAAFALDKALSGADEYLEKVIQLRELFHTNPAGGASGRLFKRILDEIQNTPVVTGA